MFSPKLDSQPIAFPIGKVVCVGRNYADHAAELNNPIPKDPVLFIKPATAVCDLTQPLSIPQGQGSVHHELEIAVLIGETISKASVEEAQEAIIGVGLGLDLTLRDVQSKLKEKGLPWERAKAFDHSCPLSGFVTSEHVVDWQNLSFELERNGKAQQSGDSGKMLFPVLELIAHISQFFTITKGDVIMTGTPKGVGPLTSGDELRLSLENWVDVTTRVV